MTHLTAAYMAIGLITAPNQLAVCEHYGNGQLDLVDNLVHYADYANALSEAGYKFCDGSPGVFDYEVCEDAGVWFGEQVLLLEPGYVPSHDACCAELSKLTFYFFLRSWPAPTPRQRCGLEDVLGAVPLPALYGGAA